MNQRTFHWSGGIPGYGDALPGGQFVVYIPGTPNPLLLNDTPLPLPGPVSLHQAAIYGRIAADGQRCAVVGHQDDTAWERSAGTWVNKGPACGQSPLIYNKDDQLVAAQCAPPTGSQGWRFLALDGTLVTGDATVVDQARGLYNYTDYGDVAIGQGAKPAQGAVVRFADDGILRRLTFQDLAPSGALRFIRVRRDGMSFFAITVVDQDQRLTTLTWATLTELRAMQPVAPTDPDIEIPPVNRALWFGAYDRGQNGSFPGNCRIRWSDTEPAVLETLAGRDLAYYVAGEPDGDPGAIERACVTAKGFQPPLPVLAYVPHGVSFPPSADWIGVEGYWKLPLGETLDQYEQRRREDIQRAARPVVFLPQTYFSNPSNAGHSDQKELRQLVPVVARILRDEPLVIGSVCFSAGDWRPTGYDDPKLHPHIAPLWEEMSTTITTPEAPVADLVVRITEHSTSVARNDPKGCHVLFDEDATYPIIQKRIGTCDAAGDWVGKPQTAKFEPEEGADGRYWRGVNFKPVIDGDWHLRYEAWDDHGNHAMVITATTVHVFTPVVDDPIAPNEMEAVENAMMEHPEIDPLDEDERGRLLDYACDDLGGEPWGRKARQADGGNKNTDAMCYLRPDGRFEIYDAISGSDGSATWDYKGIFAQGENGWWAPHDPV
jgi:hypothetical protein